MGKHPPGQYKDEEFRGRGSLTSQAQCGFCLGVCFSLTGLWRWGGEAVGRRPLPGASLDQRTQGVDSRGGKGRDLSLPSCGPSAGAPTIVSRKEWGARSLTCKAQLIPPVAYVIVHQLMEMECQEQNVCSQKLRGLQSRSVYTKGWCDVAYK